MFGIRDCDVVYWFPCTNISNQPRYVDSTFMIPTIKLKAVDGFTPKRPHWTFCSCLLVFPAR